MSVRPTDCRGCALDPQAEGFSQPEGLGSYNVALVGESLGAHEVKDSLPFREHAPAGSILQRAIRLAGLQREGFTIFNSIQCRPPRNWLDGAPYEEEALAHCKVHRDAIMAKANPKVIVALGNTALKTLTMFGRGHRRTIMSLRGYPVAAQDYDALVLPSYHPSFLLPRSTKDKGGAGGMKLLGALIYDLKRAVEIAKDGLEVKAPRFLIDPPVEAVMEFERGYDPSKHTLSYDIETPKSASIDEDALEKQGDSFHIVRISLCYNEDEALSVPWQEPYISIVKGMLTSSGPKRVWNGNFDNPRLEANHAPILGRIYDVMWGWHYLQPSLPRALDFVTPFYNWTLGPWKFEGDENPGYYSCCDALALHMNGEGIERDLRKIHAWERYESHVVDTSAVLELMSANGLPYSKEKVKEFREELQEKYDERFESIQQGIPDELKPIHPKKGYKKVPEEVKNVLGEALTQEFAATSRDLLNSWLLNDPNISLESLEISKHIELKELLQSIYDRTGMRLITVEDIVPGRCKCVESGWSELNTLVFDGAIDSNCPICKGKGVTKTNPIIVEVSRWAKVLPFLPTSSQQMKAYCNYKKYKLPKSYKTKRETTDEEALHKLMVRHNDPILRASIECRQLKKVLGTYVNGWKPGPDGRIHSTPGFWGAMYRISWRNPNISATVADKKDDYIAAGFRKCVEAPEGYVLLERDWSGIEAVLVGWFAEDKEYMRLARLGVHSFLLSHMLERPADLSWEDEKLLTYFKELKKENAARYDDAKHCIHGTNYGMGPKLMSERYEMTMATAKRLQKLYFSLFPKVRQWQISVLDRAHKEARLVNPFNYCVSPNTLVLTADLTWKPAGTLVVGERLLAFDEFPPKGKRARQFRISEVLMAQPIEAETAEVELSNGDRMVTTLDHKWLAAVHQSSKYGWCQTRHLKPGQRVMKALKTWDIATDREAGWLAGLFDGEGCLSVIACKRGGACLSIIVSQRPGLVLDMARRCLRKFGFSFSAAYGKRSDCCSLHLTGGRGEKLKFLGSIRPTRLLDKLLRVSLGELQSIEDVRVVKVTPKGTQTVSLLTTSTRTFLADGYAMHNCMWFWDVYQWDARYSKYRLGNEAKSAISFLPRDTAAGMLKEVLLRLKPLAEEGIMLCSTHDAILCQVREDDVDRVDAIVKAEMERPVLELNGLSIKSEAKVGKCWSPEEMEVRV